MYTKSILSASGIFFAVALAASTSAHAGAIDVEFQSANVAAGIFNYTLTLNGSSQLNSGDGITFYDFEGYVPGAASLTPISGGSLSLGDFTETIATNPAAPSNQDGQGTELNNSSTLNSIVQADADKNGLPDNFADANSPGDGLSNPTFDNPLITNLSFVYDSASPYSTTSPETYLLTVYTADTNALNQVAQSEIGTEGQDGLGNPSYAVGFLFTPGGPGEVPVTIPEPTTLGLLVIGAIGLVRRPSRAARK